MSTTVIRRRIGEGVRIALLVAVVGAGALAFAWPWLPRPPSGGAQMARYAPVRDGDGRLFARFDASGAISGWQSLNEVVVQPGQLFTGGARQAAAYAVLQTVRRPDEAEVPAEQVASRLEGLQVRRVQTRELDPAGQLTENISLNLRSPAGEAVVSVYYPAGEGDVVFEPPIPVLPPSLEPGQTWQAEGRMVGAGGATAGYRVEGRVIGAGPAGSPLGELDDCVLLETRLAWLNAGQPFSIILTRDRYCADLGLVESDQLTADGTLTSRLALVGADRLGARADLTPAAPPPSSQGGAREAPDEWVLTRVGRARSATDSRSTIPPTWLDGDPPLVLVAGHGGDLVALDVSGPTAQTRWRFEPGGTIYGPPAVDPEHGRIYFGAGDKRLYALDARGLFLWSFPTDDNVASRPLVVGDTLVFGSEDRAIYALDAATGARRWTVPTGGPVVSSPALAGDAVVIGSDDGGVYALDPASGEQRWLVATGGAIEAPIVAAEGFVFAVNRAGTATAIEAESGKVTWQSTLPEKDPLRTAPLLHEGQLFVVDDAGRLSIFDRNDGKRLSTTAERVYVGPPVLVDGSLILAGKDGNVYRLGFDGTVREQWAAANAHSLADGLEPGFFQLGPAAGGGTLWLADSNAVLRRLGPTPVGPTRPALAWLHFARDPPFSFGFLTPPVAYGERPVVVDGFHAAYLFDPASGAASRLGVIGGKELFSPIEPVVAGDVLLTVAGGSLFASRLPDGAPLWQASGQGQTFHPVAPAGDALLWLEQGPPGPGGLPSATLSALGLADGAVRWRTPLERVPLIGGVAVAGGRAFTSSPPAAFDPATGQVLWRSSGPAVGLAGPATDGETLFVATLDPSQGAAIVAHAAADGRERWRAPLGGQAVPEFYDRLWAEAGAVVVPLASGEIVGLDAASGAERWRYRPIPARYAGITVAGGRVWMVLEDGQLVALAATDGRVVARSNDLGLSLADAPSAQRPIVFGDRLVLPLGFQLAGFVVP